MRKPLAHALASVLLLTACPEAAAPDAGAGASDGGVIDDGADDGGEPLDGGAPELDAGDPDAGAVFDGGADAGRDMPDAGLSVQPDGGEPEDAGTDDVDGGATDGGVDAGPGLAAGDLDVEWIHGAPNCNNDSNPPLQVHAYNERTYILRQNKCVNFEGPFLFLLLGDERAILLDTGATSSAALFPVRETIEDIIADFLGNTPRADYELVVAHTHAHGDHVAGDGQFSGQPNTTLVSTSASAVASFFGLSAWPEDQTTFSLGDRTLDVIPIPGHESSHIAMYDRETGLLLTGDSLYPGHLFISSWNTYRASVARLATFASTVPVTWVLGTHVEMTSTAGQPYTYGTTYQPMEHVLELTVEHLHELDAALLALGNNPDTEVHDDFIIFP